MSEIKISDLPFSELVKEKKTLLLDNQKLRADNERLVEVARSSLSHLSTAYNWGLWLYEGEDYQEMEDEDEKENMKEDLDIVCDFINKHRDVLKELNIP